MTNFNTNLEADIIGLESPIAFVAGYGNQGMIQQVIDLISMEAADPDVPRLFLDEMSPAARISLYKILTDLQGLIGQTVFFANGGGPFAATTGWADGGAEAAANALSAAGGKLISTITAGGAGALQVYASFTSVVGVTYDITFSDMEINDALAISASNANTLAAPLATEAVDETSGPNEDGTEVDVTIRFTATATTTYFGFNATTTPADGVLFNVSSVSVAPVIPLP